VLLLCLFEDETNLPPLPPRPQAGVGSAPRIAAVKSTLRWLVEVFGSAASLHGIITTVSLPGSPLSGGSERGSTSETKSRVVQVTLSNEEDEDLYLESVARGVAEGDEVATLSTVWAMWQGWALLKFLPLYAEATSHVGCSEGEIIANLRGGEVHEGLREWLLCYFSELVRYGFKQLKKKKVEEKHVEVAAEEVMVSIEW
jgi:hypothetical protein